MGSAAVELSGAVAIVTGGAGLLGAETARRLVAGGATVVIADLADGTDLVDQLGPSATYVKTDVTVTEDVQRAVQTATGRGPLRIVVNCVGDAVVMRTLDREGRPHDLESFRRLLELNVVGVFDTMRLAAVEIAKTPALADGERGVIINVASVAGLEGSAGQVAYGTAKAAIAGMTLPAARDLGVVGIRVLAIAPGGIIEPSKAQSDDPRLQALLVNVAFPKRFGEPQEFAALVEHIVANRYLNGQTIRLDGGTRLGLKY